MDPGSHRAEALTEPSGKPAFSKGGGWASEITGKMESVIGYPPVRSSERTERRRLTEPSSKPAVLEGGIGVRNSVSRLLEDSCTRGIGVRNPPTPGDGRPKLLGKWKRKLLPTLEIPGAHRTEALTEPSGNPGVLQREEDGRPKFGSRPLDSSLRQGKGVRNSPPQGERRPKFLIVPKTPGGWASEITGEMA